MHLIPVIDLMGGRVVRALRGERQAYQPLDSPLCPAGDPFEAASRLLRASAGNTLYLADLDALMGRPRQTGLVRALFERHAGLQLWVDAGYVDVADGLAHREALTGSADPTDRSARLRPVWATESLRDARGLRSRPGAILSLDRRGAQALDTLGLTHRPEDWPGTVILMGLDRVGAATGPDLAGLTEARRRAPETQFVGAGGLRDADDAEQAGAAGAWGWLVASALHQGALGGDGHGADRPA